MSGRTKKVRHLVEALDDDLGAAVDSSRTKLDNLTQARDRVHMVRVEFHRQHERDIAPLVRLLAVGGPGIAAGVMSAVRAAAWTEDEIRDLLIRVQRYRREASRGGPRPVRRGGDRPVRRG